MKKRAIKKNLSAERSTATDEGLVAMKKRTKDGNLGAPKGGIDMTRCFKACSMQRPSSTTQARGHRPVPALLYPRAHMHCT